MLLKALEIQGFKTFPEKTRLEFQQGITAVVGPNGSGKSNVGDAIRWVLGEQSVKNLRCSKMEDVIFKGTTGRKSKGFAKVSIIIDNTDKSLPFAEDEVKVSRQYYRSGESQYLINGNVVRLKEINEIFMDTGLGRDGYAVISQGKIDSIVAAKSEDRREVFEEAAGISKYRYRKNEAIRQLSRTEDNLVRLRDIFSELEARVEPLRKQSEKANKFIKLAEEKKNIEIGLWMETVNKSSNILKTHEDKIEAAKKREEENSAQLQRVTTQAENNSKLSNNYAVEINNKRNEISEMEQQRAKRDNDIAVYKNDVQHNTERIEKIGIDIEEIIDASKNSDIEIKKFEDSAKELQKRAEELTKQLEQKDMQMQKTEEIVCEAQNLSENYEQEAERLNKLLADLNIKEAVSDTNVSDLENKKNNVSDIISKSETQINILKKELETNEKLIKNMDAELDLIQKSIEKKENILKNNETEIEKLKKQADEYTLNANEKQRQANIYAELEKNMEGYNKSVKFIMKQAENNLINGIRGPVSKLISVDKKYAVAVEIALGASAQNIVCEDEQVAKKAIYKLKEERVGRATFLPISVIRGRTINTDEFSRNKGFLGVADSFCATKEEYKEIISNILGRTILADTIDNAIAISKACNRKFRIVTLDGQVVNAGGSLTGGSISKSAGFLGRQDEIKRFQAQSEKLLKKADEIKLEISVKTEVSEKTEQEIISEKKHYDIIKNDRMRVETELVVSQKEIEKTNQALNDISAQQKSLQEEEEKLKDFIKNSAKEKEKINLQIEENNKLLESSNNEVAKKIRERELLREEVQNAKIELISAQKDVDSIKDKIDAVRKFDTEGELKIRLLKSERDNLQIKNKQIEKDIEQGSEQKQQTTEKIDKLKDEIKAIATKRLELEQKDTELRKEEREILREHEEISRDITKFEEQKISFQRSYEEIINKLWDEYEMTPGEAQQQIPPIEEPTKAKVRLAELKSSIRRLGDVNLSAVEEYKEVFTRYEFMKAQIGDVERSKNELTRQINKLTNDMEKQFLDRFNEINKQFREIFVILFSGGEGHLELSDENDILNCGIDIIVQPPGKVVSSLSLLSGGEKALVSIVLYFAIMRVNPVPFCVLDEIEAALDDINIDRFVAYLKKINDKTQFIIITHRRGTMDNADMLYGVTMQEKGISTLLQLNTSELVAENT